MEQQRSLEELRQESHPHACLDGHVYLGIIRINEDGEEEEVITRAKCRRCEAERQRIPQRWFPALVSSAGRRSVTGEPGDVRTALIVFALLAILFVFLGLWANYDLPNVVNCTDTDALIVTVDISAARRGELIKHEFFGCDWYWYTAGARGD